MKWYRWHTRLWYSAMVIGTVIVMGAVLTDHAEFAWGVVVGTVGMVMLESASDNLHRRMKVHHDA